MIAKLEWTQSNAQQNIEQLQNPTKGVTNNNRTTALERTAAKAIWGGGGGGGLNVYYWYQIHIVTYEVRKAILKMCAYFYRI